MKKSDSKKHPIPWVCVCMAEASEGEEDSGVNFTLLNKISSHALVEKKVAACKQCKQDYIDRELWTF